MTNREGGEEDLWACFGDNESQDESDDEVLAEEENEEKRLLLLAKANANANAKELNPCSVTTIDGHLEENELTHVHEESYKLPQPIQIWTHRPPLYISPSIAVVQDDNLYRGYIATANLNPGTLLLVEQPAFKWPTSQIGSELDLSSIQAIVGEQNKEYAQQLVHDMEYLYPTKWDVNDIMMATQKVTADEDDYETNEKIQIKDMVEIMQMQHSGSKALEKILKIAQERQISTSADDDSDGTGSIGCGRIIDEIDIMRMLLTLRYNGFDSGLYLHFAMFNHCDDANCIKYVPEQQRGGGGKTTNKNQDMTYSEVRTTKYIKKGQALTLHYLNPREVSHATRRLHIWDQHRFDIGDGMKHFNPKFKELEFIHDEFPKSCADKQDKERMTYHIENAINDLEKLYKEIKIASQFILHALTQQQIMDDTAIETFERCKALEFATQELIQVTIEKTGNEKHLLLIRCCRLHLDSIELLLQFGNHPQPLLTLTNKQQNEIISRFIVTCHKLLPIQIQYLGQDHPDIARTYYDFAMGLNSLLSHAPKRLFDLGIQDLNNFSSCQQYEAKCRNEYRRIDSFYPRDVEQKISGSD